MITQNNAQFKRDFARRVAAAGERANEVVREVARGMVAGMIEKSPVGDPSQWARRGPPGYVGGRFKNNWNCSVVGINLQTGAPIDASGAGAVDRAKAALAKWEPGQTIYITNSMPYAYRLEYEGWSRQAPAGMVRTTVAEFGMALRDAAKKMGRK
jgi:hypothetical protein